MPAPAQIGNPVLGIPEGADVELDLRLEAVMEGVLVTGVARSRAVGECVRCLADVERDVEAPFQELYVYPDTEVDADEAEETLRLDGDLLDLEQVLRDAVVLALPMVPVCREDCPGLCPQCGARLAEEPAHAHDAVDPRWAGLQDLLDSNSSKET